jgi:hypothetical protein
MNPWVGWTYWTYCEVLTRLKQGQIVETPAGGGDEKQVLAAGVFVFWRSRGIALRSLELLLHRE